MAEQQINSQIQTNNEELTNTITLHDIIRMVIANWYWFVLSTVCCLCAAYYYLASTPKIYSRTATILVKDSRKGGDVDLTAFSDLAGFQNRRNVDNEVFILQSRRLMTNVVKQLNLTVNYSVSDGLRRRDLYGQAPIDVKFINDNDNQSLAMEITPIDDDKIRLSEFKDQFVTKHESRSVITAAYGDTIPTPVGQVVVQKSLYMAPDYIGVPIRVTKSSLGRTTNAYRAAVKSDVANKQASVVTISMNNTVPRRAEDVINTLIEAYNEDAIEDKRRVSVATGKFIKARLDVIGRELGDVDRNIEDIKKDNRMVDITSEAARSVSESSRYKTEGLSLENQINVAEYIRTYLNDPKNVGELIPAMAAVGVELQPDAAQLCRNNLEANGLTGRAQILCADLRAHRTLLPAGSFDLVVANPPYFAAGSGYTSPDPMRAHARDERTCTMQDICTAMAYLTRWGGSAALVHRPERLSELLCALTAAGLEPKRLRTVAHTAHAAPSLVLVEARRGGKPGLTVSPPLALCTPDGADSDEIRRIYHRRTQL